MQILFREYNLLYCGAPNIITLSFQAMACQQNQIEYPKDIKVLKVRLFVVDHFNAGKLNRFHFCILRKDGLKHWFFLEPVSNL